MPLGASASVRTRLVALAICAALLTAYLAQTLSATLQKSPAYDESSHAFDAWMMTRHGDYRLAPEDPALWHFWAALPNSREVLQVDFQDASWKELPGHWPAHMPFLIKTLYRTPGNDGVAFINRSRVMMAILSTGLGAILMAWAWRLSGPLGSIITGALFAFDPNFLAHGSLVQNDVAIALMYIAVTWGVWRWGQRLTIARVVVLGILLGCALCVKASALVLLPIVAVLGVARVSISAQWHPSESPDKRPVFRSLKLTACGLSIAFLCFLTIWCVYRFRFGLAADPEVHFDVTPILGHMMLSDLAGDDPNATLTRSALENWTPPPLANFALHAIDGRWLPEPYAFGLLATDQLTRDRPTYFLGENRVAGSSWYFPFVFIVKTPLVTIVTLVLATFLGLRMLLRTRLTPEQVWTLVCLILPPGVYLCLAIYQQFNLGVRHILILYAFAYVLTGVTLARFLSSGRTIETKFKRRSLPLAMAGCLFIGLVIESVLAYPNYIPFYNILAGGSRGGLTLLGDSNLDWGQDLPALAQWQKTHTDKPLYLSYFGTVDPKAYGIDAITLLGGYQWSETGEFPTVPAYVALSATQLQGIYLTPEGRMIYRRFVATLKPLTVLGGSIYIYESHGRN